MPGKVGSRLRAFEKVGRDGAKAENHCYAGLDMVLRSQESCSDPGSDTTGEGNGEEAFQIASAFKTHHWLFEFPACGTLGLDFQWHGAGTTPTEVDGREGSSASLKNQT